LCSLRFPPSKQAGKHDKKGNEGELDEM